MPELSWFENPGDEIVYGCDLSKLRINEACLVPRCGADLTTNQFIINQKHKECEECPFQEWKTINCTENQESIILSNVPQYLYEIETDNFKIVPKQNEIGEFGVFKLQVNKDTCWFETLKEPVSIYFPILTVFLIYCGIIGVIYLMNYIWKRIMIPITDLNNDKNKKKQRIKSLDTFRGISIVIMIFANYGAGGYEFIEHAIWNGLHVADLVFPWFMWIMGACIPISLMSAFKKETPNIKIVQNVLVRSIKLFCVGVFLQSGTVLKTLRIFGVLQRFGVSYLVVTVICVYFLDRRPIPEEKTNKMKIIFWDLLKMWRCWLINFGVLIFYLLVIFLVHKEGCPRGYFGPGGWHKNGSYFNCTGGATGFIDGLILGDHKYQWLETGDVYGAEPFDPEGIVGCLTSIFHVFLGVQAGIILTVYKNHQDRIIRWLIWAILLGLIGGGLCGFSKNDGLIPVNKNLWSISFCLVTSCFAFTLLSICYILIDLKRWWNGQPFFYPGMNAILMYIGHETIYQQFPVRWTIDDMGHRTHFLNLFENVWATIFWVIVSCYLYKINYFFVI